MKKVQKTFLATLAAATLALGSAPPAGAMTPDSLYPLSGVWSSARVMSEYFDWRSFSGWGAIGLTNVLITAGTGQSQGQLTRAVFTEICGATAAGTLAVWKPRSDPTVASHLKAIMKAGGVVAAASACGWVSHFAFNTIDKEISNAQDAMNHKMSSGEVARAHSDANNINNDLTAMQGYYREVTAGLSNADAARKRIAASCGNPNSAGCLDARKTLKESLARAQDNLNRFNNKGQWLHDDLDTINHDIRS